jgi:3',5'-cyclic AMP phosphodiesterase CpdA
MKSSMTIAHISDLHLSREHKRYNLRRACRLLEAVIQHNVDHVVITGDIAADADRGDFEAARKLFSSVGLLDTRRLSLVIGNHDIFGGVHRAEDILTFPRRCRDTEFGKKVEQFREYFHETFSRCLFGAPWGPFPFAKILGDTVLIGLNSVAHYSRIKNPIGSNGEVSDAQFRRTQQILEAPELRPKRKIVLIHHHFNKIEGAESGTLHTVWGTIERQTMKLRGKKRLIELMRENEVALVLHGHVHENVSYERKGIKFLNGGGSLLGPFSPVSSFNLVELHDGSIETRTIMVPEEEPSLPALAEMPGIAGLQAA